MEARFNEDTSDVTLQSLTEDRSPIMRSEFGKDPKQSPCKFTIERKLSRGTFGEVFVGSNLSGELVALKKISKNSEKYDCGMVKREICALQILKHEGIVEFRSSFQTSNNVFLVFELLVGQDLHAFMAKRLFQPLREDEAIYIAQQIFGAVLYCHRHGIAHRDLKWDNIFMKDSTIKLLDFGLCTPQMEESELCKDFVGSRAFAAPEVLARRPYQGFKADVFSCGKILYGLIFGKIEIERIDPTTIRWPDRTIPQFPNFVSRSVKDLLSRMLDPNPQTRFTMLQVSRHRWVT